MQQRKRCHGLTTKGERCTRKGIYQHDGKWYCRLHGPIEPPAPPQGHATYRPAQNQANG